MKIHGIQLAEGSNVSNLVVASGPSFPGQADEGELFFRTDASVAIRGLYFYVDGTWDRIATSDSTTVPTGTSFPGAANPGDLFYKNTNDSEEGLYVYNDSTWVLTSGDTALNVLKAGDTMTGSLLITSAAPQLVVGTSGISGRIGSTSTTGISAAGMIVNAGDVTSAASHSAGPLNLRGGNIISGTGNGGDVVISGGTGSTAGNIFLETNGVSRLRITAAGAWGFGGANYGASGQVLTSTGSSTPPSWQSLVPSQLANSVTLGTTAAATLITASPSAGGVAQAMTISGSTGSSGSGGGQAILRGGQGSSPSGAGGTAFLIGGTPSSGGAGGAVALSASNAGASSGATGGNVGLTGGSGNAGGSGGTISLTSGTAGVTGTGGSINLNAAAGGTTSGGGGSISILAGVAAGATGNGGNISISAGNSVNGNPGSIILFTGASIERLRITATGAWGLGGAANYGTSGQMLMSNGNAQPTWSSALTGSASLNVLKAGDTMTGDLQITRNVNTSAGISVTNNSTGAVAAASIFVVNNLGDISGFETYGGGYPSFGRQTWFFSSNTSEPLVFSAGAAAPGQLRLLSTGQALFCGKTLTNTTEAGAYFESASSLQYGRCNFIKATGSGTGATPALRFFYNGTQVGEITNSSTATAYNTSSDVRLKENIADAPSAGTLIDALQVRSFNFKSEPSQTIDFGFIAQELHTVIPEAVSVGDSSETVTDAWGVDYSKLVPLLVKEIQELRARIAALEQS